MKQNDSVIQDQPLYIRVIEYCISKKKLLKNILLGILVLGVVGWYYRTSVIIPQEEEALALLYQPLREYASGVDFSSGQMGNGGAEVVVNQLFTQALDGLETDQKVFEGLLFITDNHSGTKAANLASYVVGTIYLHTGEYQMALDYLSDFSLDDPLLTPTALGCMGDASVELEDYNAAASYYEDAISFDNKITTPRYLKKLALVYEHTQNYNDALSAYKTLQSKYPFSLQSRVVAGDIARVEYLLKK